MKIFLCIAIIIFLFIIFKKNKFKKVLKDKKSISFSKNNLYDWMNLTKKERYNLSKKDSDSYLDKRKILLDKIRKEYKSISKSDHENVS
tara:strand:- start:232 stop:498 length:267 start_codon:yes stop_codon:yes gene_type:complete